MLLSVDHFQDMGIFFPSITEEDGIAQAEKPRGLKDSILPFSENGFLLFLFLPSPKLGLAY